MLRPSTLLATGPGRFNRAGAPPARGAPAASSSAPKVQPRGGTVWHGTTGFRGLRAGASPGGSGGPGAGAPGSARASRVVVARGTAGGGSRRRPGSSRRAGGGRGSAGARTGGARVAATAGTRVATAPVG